MTSYRTGVKLFSGRRVDDRPIEDKAYGLIFAMDTIAAQRLLRKLEEQKAHDSQRAAMFCGKQKEKLDD